ncbi:membrane protein [Oceanicola sp. 22II-s10i]|uniref:PACE efflux transporter n=1 Tax=Oceanicola sp. 22II-s10i TaxID=1317116 RepID=UPI000B521927|nr:PACE efflux transporter [Oceanicola sp. 22II-s10i]OWU85731.1 membrane protein [Oceanicola sp. 22II-s10i]
MRTARDRIRHAISFEVIALLTVVPLGTLVFDVHAGAFGVVAVVSTFLAMAWNYWFNLGFDRAMLRRLGTLRKSFPIRMLHAALFEAGLLLLLVPFIAWYLDMPLWRALVVDLALAGFYFVYALAFNWAYDVVFPVPLSDGAAR